MSLIDFSQLAFTVLYFKPLIRAVLAEENIVFSHIIFKKEILRFAKRDWYNCRL